MDYPVWFSQNNFLEFSCPDLSEYQGTTGTYRYIIITHKYIQPSTLTDMYQVPVLVGYHLKAYYSPKVAVDAKLRKMENFMLTLLSWHRLSTRAHVYGEILVIE